MWPTRRRRATRTRPRRATRRLPLATCYLAPLLPPTTYHLLTLTLTLTLTKAAWTKGQGYANAYLDIVNRAINAKVGDKFGQIEGSI